MKKTLMTSTVLAGAVVMAGSAIAEAPTVDFKGNIRYYLRTTNNDVKNDGPGWGIGIHDPASELQWDVNGTADNGLQYGGRIEYRYAASATDEAWLDFKGGFGTIVVGDDDPVLDNTQVYGGSVMPIAAWDTGRFTGGITGGGTVNTSTAAFTPTVIGATGDASKIAYYSPDFAGFSFGASITPDSAATFGTVEAANGTSSQYRNVVDVVVNYSGTFGDVDVAAHGGYVFGNTVANAFGQTASAGTELEDVGAFQLGASINVANFGLAFGYADNDESGCDTNTYSGCDAGSWYDVGASYDFGAGAIGVGYFYGENEWNGANEHSRETISLESSYNVAEGMSAFAGVAWTTQEENATGLSISDDSTVFVVGTTLSFSD